MKFLIIGGDQRSLKLKQMLKEDGHEIKCYGLEIEDETKIYGLENDIKQNCKNVNSEKIKTLENLEKLEFDAVIGPIPFTKDGKNLNAPYIQDKITLESLLKPLKNQTLIAGPISKQLKSELEDSKIKVIDIMEVEELVIYNTIATAEGTIELAISNTEINLHESKILILGFGRVAKTLALKLKGLAKEVVCAARKPKDFAWMDTLGFSIENINNLDNNLSKYDIIINTVPEIILTKQKLEKIKRETLIIDLASKPGGIDKSEAERLKLKYIWALGLPGKVAPLSSAKYIKNTIYNIMKK